MKQAKPDSPRDVFCCLKSDIVSKAVDCFKSYQLQELASCRPRRMRFITCILEEILMDNNVSVTFLACHVHGTYTQYTCKTCLKTVSRVCTVQAKF